MKKNQKFLRLMKSSTASGNKCFLERQGDIEDFHPEDCIDHKENKCANDIENTKEW